MIAGPAYQEFIDAAGSSGENITSAAWWHPAAQYSGKDIFGTTANYVKLFREKYKSDPDYAQASASVSRCAVPDGHRARRVARPRQGA